MRRLVSFLISILFIVGGVWAAFHYQFFIDQYVAATYKVPPQVASLIYELRFSDRSEFLVRATQASLDDRVAFNSHCDKKDSGSITLGCYISPQHLYVYNVNDTRLDGVKQVTLAHEMLHAAYSRLSNEEKVRVNKKIQSALSGILDTHPDLQKRLQIYEKTEPGERNNELHSILGTEVSNLPAGLESYYKQYFRDRRIITNFAAKYARVFQDLKTNQDQLVADLQQLNQSIQKQVDIYNTDIAALNGRIESFNSRAARLGGFSSESEFESEKFQLQNERDRLASEKEAINTHIETYEQKRSQLEALNVQVEDLNTKLDSTKLPSL